MTDSISFSEEPSAKRLKSSCSSATTSAIASTIYQPLDKAKNEIRICDLFLSLELSAPLKCSLRTVSLDEVGTYVAFSYVWGQEPATETISIDENELLIRPNLAAGLRRFRAMSWQNGQQRHPRVSIWVDAICIDQNSIEERNHQVPLMRRIFSGSDCTFSWLGESDDTSDLAMDSIAKIAAIVKVDLGISEGLELGSDLPRRLTERYFPFWEAGPWVAIHKLLSRDFWHRVWIFQEIVLPRELLLACGSKCIPWTTFSVLDNLRINISFCNNNYRLFREELTHLSSITQNEIIAVCRILQSYCFMFMSKSKGHSNLTLLGYLREMSHLKAADARDKIYGLLALDKKTTLLPDYSKTTSQVYTEFAKSILKDNLEVLQYSGLSTRGNNTDLASWVPSWDHFVQLESTTAARWKDWLDTFCYWPSVMRRRTRVRFHDLSHLTALHVRGQLRSKITDVKSQEGWLEASNYKMTINSMYGQLYPCWSENGQINRPIQKLVALQHTLVQDSLFSEDLRNSKEATELAAGFCHSTMSRLSSASEVSASKLSVSILLEVLASRFEQQPAAFNHPEQYENDYLMSENESLYGRVFFETSSGRFGLGPPSIKNGDIICNIYGFYFPVVLREIESHYVLVGTCWVLGCMLDQGLEDSKSTMLEIW